jgi:quinol-cytochrome oxidoreductase complex cytochrome b subunit
MNLRSLAALNILLSTLESAPLPGKWLAGILRGASSLSSPTLVRVYALHVLFIPAVLAASWYALRTTLIWRGQTITNTEATGKEWVRNVLLGIGIVWVSVMMACCITTPPNLALVNLPADFTAVIAAPQQSQPEWYALGIAALLRVFPAWGMMTGLGVWISLATALPFVTRLSASLAMIVRGTCSVALLGLCVLTLWELQWYTFPTVILTEENLELVIVISILSGLLGGVLTARLRQES